MSENTPAQWMQDRLPLDAIPIEREAPPDLAYVLGWVSDPGVAIHFYPVVVRRDGPVYWGGIPGDHFKLKDCWTLTHWRHITPQAT